MDRNNLSATMIELSDEALANVMGGDGYGGGGDSQGDCNNNSWDQGYDSNNGDLMGLLKGLNSNRGPLGLLGLNNGNSPSGLLSSLGLPLGL